MLEHLDVRGLGIIDRVELSFPPGFVALTGETGAGKSLLVESLKLISGQRAQADLVRTGNEKLRVEGGFAVQAGSPVCEVLSELGVDHEGSLVIRREVSAAGRSRSWINDVVVTAGALQRLAPHLLAIHGQHEQHGIGESRRQRALVDDFGGHDELLAATRGAHALWQEASDEVLRLRAASDKRRDRLDAISFQLAEIDAAAPHAGEDVKLEQRRLLLRHAVRLLELSQAVLGRVSEGDGAVVDALAKAEREVAEMVSCGLGLSEAVDRLVEARVLVEDAVRSVQDLVGEVDEDPRELESVESRLFLLEQLMLKYGSPLESVLSHREALVEERRELAHVEENLEASTRHAAEALVSYEAAAAALDAARRRAGEEMARQVEEVLGRLGMAGTRLEFHWQEVDDSSSRLLRDGRPVAFTADGVEECELYFAANPGEAPRPMARVASGGELSRLHLGIRTVLRGRLGSSALTLLFDEVDSGLGGATASALAALLADLAAHDQVMVVTHIPQVAAGASGHFRISKVMDGERSVTRVHKLGGTEREHEIARMLAGEEIGPSALAHARDLMGDP